MQPFYMRGGKPHCPFASMALLMSGEAVEHLEARSTWLLRRQLSPGGSINKAKYWWLSRHPEPVPWQQYLMLIRYRALRRELQRA